MSSPGRALHSTRWQTSTCSNPNPYPYPNPNPNPNPNQADLDMLADCDYFVLLFRSAMSRVAYYPQS